MTAWAALFDIKETYHGSHQSIIGDVEKVLNCAFIDCFCIFGKKQGKFIPDSNTYSHDTVFHKNATISVILLQEKTKSLSRQCCIFSLHHLVIGHRKSAFLKPQAILSFLTSHFCILLSKKAKAKKHKRFLA